MAFFDKISEMTKNLSDSVGTNAEISRFKREIASQEAMITEYKSLLGEYFWNAHLDGTVADEGADDLFAKIAESYDAIKVSEGEIERLKEEAQKAKEEREAAREAAKEAKTVETKTVAEGQLLCPECGAYVWQGNKFCPECGAKLEPPAPIAEPEPEPPAVCANCGAQYPENAKFCPECGAPR